MRAAAAGGVQALFLGYHHHASGAPTIKPEYCQAKHLAKDKGSLGLHPANACARRDAVRLAKPVFWEREGLYRCILCRIRRESRVLGG
jgi:hypothetical protein